MGKSQTQNEAIPNFLVMVKFLKRVMESPFGSVVVEGG